MKVGSMQDYFVLARQISNVIVMLNNTSKSHPTLSIIAGKKEKHNKLQLTLAKKNQTIKTHLNLEKSFKKKGGGGNEMSYTS